MDTWEAHLAQHIFITLTETTGFRLSDCLPVIAVAVTVLELLLVFHPPEWLLERLVPDQTARFMYLILMVIIGLKARY